MRRAIGQSLRIFVSPQSVSVQRISRWRGERVTTLAQQAITPSADHPFDAIAHALRAVPGELEVKGWPVNIELADELTRMWRVTPPPGAARLADLEAAAGLRFQSLYGEAPSEWLVSADWSAHQPFFAAAMPRALLALLELVARECKLTIVGVAPCFVAAWNRCRRGIKRDAWFGVMRDQVLTLAATGTDGSVHAIRSQPVPRDAGQQWLTQTLQRTALLLDLEAPQLMQVHGAAPDAWIAPSSSAAHIRCLALEGSAA